MNNEKFTVGRDRPQGAEILDGSGNEAALVYGETKREARDRAERIALLLSVFGIETPKDCATCKNSGVVAKRAGSFTMIACPDCRRTREERTLLTLVADQSIGR